MPQFGKVSEANLLHVHPDLVKLARFVVERWDCSVTDGIRSIEEQRLNIAKKVSQTMNSYHLPRNEKGELDENGLAWAIDMPPYPIDWEAIERGIAAVKKVDPGQSTLEAYMFHGFVLGVAEALGLRVSGGLDWDGDRDLADSTFIDLPHFQKKP
jgi:hypothetical protein